MTAPAADLTGWTCTPFTGAGITYDVYQKGEGPGVVLIPELPGIHPMVLGLGNHLVDNGFTVAIPSLFGVPGKDVSAPYAVSGLARNACTRIHGTGHQCQPPCRAISSRAGPTPCRPPTA